MDINSLVKLGLSKTEAILYSALISLGASDVQKLLNKTGFYKSNTYDALERLCEKGLISKIISGNKRIYQLENPNSLIEFIQNKKNELYEQEQLANELSKQVKLSKKHKISAQTASVFTGIAGIKQIYSEIVEKKLNYLVFGSPIESETLVGDYYWKNLHAKQKEYKIKAKMIFNKSLRKWSKLISKEIAELRFFDNQFEPLTETTIYGSKVAFVVWTDKPVITIIDNEHVANSYRQVFNMLWKLSKP